LTYYITIFPSLYEAKLKGVSMFSLLNRFLIRIFVDSSWPYVFWHCHRLPERSFKITGRQFHICARCTGIVFGFSFVPFVMLIGCMTIPLSIAMIAMLLFDAMTQLLGWRKSNNVLRLITGIFVGSFVPAAILNLLWRSIH